MKELFIYINHYLKTGLLAYTVILFIKILNLENLKKLYLPEKEEKVKF